MLSEVLKQRNAVVRRKSSRYLRKYGQFTFSAFTRFEIVRGLKEKSAKALSVRFATFCTHFLILPVTDSVLERASDLWALARHNGHPHGDADLIIAATAMDSGRILVRGNEAHFAWIPGLALESWREP
jgi:predicted nucleic acid-binding protein